MLSVPESDRKLEPADKRCGERVDIEGNDRSEAITRPKLCVDNNNLCAMNSHSP